MRECCPVCETKNCKSFFRRDFSAICELTPFKLYDVCVCPECGMVFAGNIIESMSLEAYYMMLSKY